jgi:hypothetical protein
MLTFFHIKQNCLMQMMDSMSGLSSNLPLPGSKTRLVKPHKRVGRDAFFLKDKKRVESTYPRSRLLSKSEPKVGRVIVRNDNPSFSIRWTTVL